MYTTTLKRSRYASRLCMEGRCGAISPAASTFILGPEAHASF